MRTLAQQQNLLLEALLAWPAHDAMKKVAACAQDTGARGIKAYQANGHALAQRALQAAYPVVYQLVGEESFSDLSGALWHAHPPQHGDVAQWGQALGAFMEASEQLATEPYLAEVAQVEWAMHTAGTAADGAADLASLALLTTEDPAALTLAFGPGMQLFQCTWPVASIVSAHLEGVPAFDKVAQLLRDRTPQDMVIWREGLHVRQRECLAGEHDVVSALQAGRSLADALDAAPLLDFAVWFPSALQSGLVLGVTPISSPEPDL